MSVVQLTRGILFSGAASARWYNSRTLGTTFGRVILSDCFASGLLSYAKDLFEHANLGPHDFAFHRAAVRRSAGSSARSGSGPYFDKPASSKV